LDEPEFSVVMPCLGDAKTLRVSPLARRMWYNRIMVAAIRQFVKVEAGGVVRVRSPKLKPGAEAEVIVLLPRGGKRANGARSKPNGRAKRKARVRRVPVAKMTAEVRGDIAWAKKIMRDPAEVPVPYERVRKRLGLA